MPLIQRGRVSKFRTTEPCGKGLWLARRLCAWPEISDGSDRSRQRLPRPRGPSKVGAPQQAAGLR